MLAALHREEHVERLALVGLGDTDVLALLEALAGHQLGDDGAPCCVMRLLAETPGIRSSLVEMLRHLAETGAIVQTDAGRWEASADLRESRTADQRREVIMRRVDRLGPGRGGPWSSPPSSDMTSRSISSPPSSTAMSTKPSMSSNPAVAASLVTDIEPGHFSFAHALTGPRCTTGVDAYAARAVPNVLVASTLEAQLGESPGPRRGRTGPPLGPGHDRARNR